MTLPAWCFTCGAEIWRDESIRCSTCLACRIQAQNDSYFYLQRQHAVQKKLSALPKSKKGK